MRRAFGVRAQYKRVSWRGGVPRVSCVGRWHWEGPQAGLPYPVASAKSRCRVLSQRSVTHWPDGAGKKKASCHATHHYQHGDCLGAPNSSRNILVAAQLVVLPQNGSDGCWFVLAPFWPHHCLRIDVSHDAVAILAQALVDKPFKMSRCDHLSRGYQRWWLPANRGHQQRGV